MTLDSTTPTRIRVANYTLILGGPSAVAFVVIGCVSVIGTGSFKNPLAAAALFCIFWGAWFIASLYMIAQYCFEHLLVTDDSIEHHGVFRSRNIAFKDITSIEWLNPPFRRWTDPPLLGRVNLHSQAKVMKLNLDHYASPGNSRLVEILRDAVPHETTQRFHQPSRASLIISSTIFSFFAASTICCWLLGFGSGWLLLGVVYLVAATWWTVMSCLYPY